jgi:hypothetical protein
MQTINVGSTSTTAYKTATNLCAYKQSYTETDAEACAEVVLRPEVMRHVLDDRPVRFPLLFVRHGLLSKQRATFRRS